MLINQKIINGKIKQNNMKNKKEKLFNVQQLK